MTKNKDRIMYSDPEDRIFNCVIADISIVLGETTLTRSISDSMGTVVRYPHHTPLQWTE